MDTSLEYMKVGILGYGEVGGSILKVYKDFEVYDVKLKDLDRDDGLEGIEVLNVCIPYTESFEKQVISEVNKYKPSLTIIHSTVQPGTTSAIKEKLPEECSIVHSPIRGLHPNLYEGIKTFVKFIGGDDQKARNKAKAHLESLKLNVKILSGSKESEIGKLLDTTYYGLAIAWHGEMKKLCEKYGVNFEEAVTDFNKSYNEGYIKFGKPEVVRPVLHPPNPKIGGHCIINNAKILDKIWDSKAIDLLLEYD